MQLGDVIKSVNGVTPTPESPASTLLASPPREGEHTLEIYRRVDESDKGSTGWEDGGRGGEVTSTTPTGDAPSLIRPPPSCKASSRDSGRWVDGMGGEGVKGGRASSSPDSYKPVPIQSQLPAYAVDIPTFRCGEGGMT